MKRQEHPTEVHDVDITFLDKKGFGRGNVLFDTSGNKPRKLRLTVPLTLPNETVRVTIPNARGRKRGTLFPDQILTESNERVAPPCPHFELCGGCTWQHWGYKHQLNHKYEEVIKFLKEKGFDENVVKPAIGMETPFFYRNKMEFTFGKDGHLGLHEQGNFRKVIPLETCLLASEKMVKVLKIVGRWQEKHELSGYDKDEHQGDLRHLMVREGKSSEELMVAIFSTKQPSELESAVKDLIDQLTYELPDIQSLMWMVNNDMADRAQSEETHLLYGREYIRDTFYGYHFRLWYDTFFQPNPLQAENMVDIALELAQVKSSDSVLDLFCGVGTFSLPFAKRAKRLAGVEIVETSIESAKRNAQDNGIDNTYFLASDARRGMDQVLKEWGTPDLLLLDPPRSGAGGKVMRRIGRLGTDKVVYVSCNPETFAEDIVWLREYGYELKVVQPVDQFPQTPHVEVVALLMR